MSEKSKAYIALVTTMLLWASAFVGIRAGLEAYSPVGLAVLRFIIASIFMGIIFYKLPQKERMNPKEWVIGIVAGILGIGVYNLSLNVGEVSVDAGTASFLISQSPMLATLFAVLFLKERIRPLGILGLIFCFIGVCIIGLDQIHHFASTSTGLWFVIIATFMSAIFSILQKPLLTRLHPIQVTAIAIWTGTLCMLYFSPALITDLSTATLSATLVILYLGIFPGAIAYVLWTYGLARLQAFQAVSFLNFMPIAAVLMSWLFLSEVPTLMVISGGLLATFGTVLINFQKTR